jgi:eukaryotic-like serine/threonine-protein kinase
MAVVETIGTPFGRYRLLERLGEGGMAVVYRAVAEGPEGFRRDLVIKRVRPSLSSEPEFARMLAAEARVSALLNHPNVVAVYELGEVDGEQYLVMEHVDGVDLDVLLRRAAALGRPPPLGACCFIVGRVAAALAYAHDLRDQGRPLSIIHRDVSPSNVMVTRSGGVKLLDFGIAKATSTLRHEKTITGVIRGKLGYLSPEQAASKPIDRRSDVFALGVVLFELIEGKRLFRGRDDLETINLVREAEVPALARPEIPAALEALLRRMLARDPDARPAHCDEIVAALAPILHELHGDEASLRAFVEQLEVLHQQHELEAEVGEPASATSDKTNVAIRPTPSVRRRRSRALPAVLGIAGLLAMTGFALLTKRASSTLTVQAIEPSPVAAPPAPASRLDAPSIGPTPNVAPASAPPPRAAAHSVKSHPSKTHRATAAAPARPTPARDDELRPF